MGKPTKLAGKFGKSLTSQMFLNPKTGEEEEFVLFEQRPWSVVLAITEDGQVLMVREYKQGRDGIEWELPAGTANFADEAPETVMRRELREETGYEAGKVTYLGHGWMSSRNSPTQFHCFLATGCELVGEQQLDSGEDIERGLVKVDEWLRMVVAGEINEPSAVMTTMRALAHLGVCITTKA
ncbi:MAG: NUDIX hydrolase [Candidatus Magasanikbacteria bacterium]|nr:NUDIX hydrolase [Candidatus Magasanikbacteria bacterium]